ncbi:MAG: Gfo/Idh/MocA family oxidoreductase [Acidimicrobiia bacterium]|nr:Gfo/Idh/MocA family oxidoreductase [Acidimicrobiia bacterium]MDX2466176.1 Gfo/Idh/MocA family oxidoreductase [Acidimicrobiia bacterium]
MNPVGIAVVGVGYWGPNLIRNFAASEKTDLRWACDISVDRAHKVVGAQSVVRVTDDLEDVLCDPGVEAVAIATPPSTHAAIALRCFEAGRHVLVEKPLAEKLEDGQAMVQAAADSALTLMCDHTFCYTSSVRKIKEIVHSDDFGDVLYFDSVRVNLGLIQRDVDVFWDLGPHDLSILDYVLPDGIHPTAIAAHAADPMNVGQPCVGYMTLPLSNGGSAHAHLNWLSPTKIRTTIIGGSKRMLVWDDLRPGQRIHVYDSGIDLEEIDDEARRAMLVSYRSGDMVAPAVPETEALRAVVEEFADSIREQRPPLTDGQAGLRVLEALTSVQRSLDSMGSMQPLGGRS